MFKRTGLTIAALLLSTTMAATQPACLPKSVFVNTEGQFPLIELGTVGKIPTLCAYERALGSEAGKPLGCWTVDLKTGALGASTASGLPGRGHRVDLDTKGCANGYCIPPADGQKPFFAVSTDGKHAAILTTERLTIFDTKTKAKVTDIELAKADAPEQTNVSNSAWGLLYNGDTLFVIGADAGPFIGVWVFKENGDRAGRVIIGEDSVNVFNGGYGILGADRVALVDAGLQNLTIVTGANAAKKTTKRTVSYTPCTKDQFEEWTLGDDGSLKGACKAAIDAKYRPYVDVSPIQAPSGDIVVALSGPAQGSLAVLNPATLKETRRLKLARCS